jgi:hypothetical protein
MLPLQFRALQVSQPRITQLLNLLKLAPELQARILAGEFGYVSEHYLRDCVRYESKQKQLRMLEENAQLARPAFAGKAVRKSRSGRRTARLRLVLYFNPQMCIEQRITAEAHRQSVEDFASDLNRRLHSERTRLTPESMQSLLTERLAYHSFLKLYTIHLDLVGPPGSDCKVPQLRLEFDEHEWHRRRRHDGFVLLVAHPEIPMKALELVELYRAKDAVEKDFRTIKDVVRLRPVYHHTDPKVRAHVTLCMLALLLERTLEQRLRRSSMPMTAPACFETLASCHLNLLQTDPDLPPTYSMTEPNTEQRDLLKVLRMGDLVDAEEVAPRIQPRAPSQG